MSQKKSKQVQKKASRPREFENQCEFLYVDGRRCRQFRLRGNKSLCPQHAIQEGQFRDSKEIAPELLGPLDDFRSAQAVNRALGKLFSLTAKNRIPVRNAAVLASIGQVLLQSLSPVRNEIIEAGGAHNLDVIFRDALALLSNEMHADTPDAPPRSIPIPKPRQTLEQRLRPGIDKLVAPGVVFTWPQDGPRIRKKEEKEEGEEETETEG